MRVYIRKTEIHDCDDILQWRNDPVTRSQSFQSKLISDSNHRVWFDQMLIDSKQHAYVGFGDSEKTKIGFVHLKHNSAGTCTVSINLNPNHRGKALGSKLLQKAIKDHSSYNDVVYLALIKPTNLASIRCFEKAGFALYDRKSDVFTMINKTVLIDKIEKVRAKNNVNWMNLMRLAFAKSPKEAEKIFEKINREDNHIADLLSLLAAPPNIHNKKL